MAGLIRRDGLPSGEGGPRAMQHVLPLMAQFVDDNKGNSGSKLTKKSTEKSRKGFTDREKGTNEVTNVTVGDHTIRVGTSSAPSIFMNDYIVLYIL